jgi:hypothetical protein
VPSKIHRPNMTCADCAKPIFSGSESRPQGQARCQPCHFADMRRRRKHGASAYQKGCRCEVCKQAIYAANRERYWIKNRFGTTGPRERTCMICGVIFLVGAKPHRAPAAKTCSPECAQQRQLTKAGDVPDPQAWRHQGGDDGLDEAFKRDGWRCHICRRKLKHTTRWPHPRTPSLDHLIPLTRGGLHLPANVATACLSCNSSKGNRGGNEQLLLIG